MIKITDNTPALLSAVDDKIEDALTEAGQVVEQEAKRIVHVVTGATRDSIDALPPAKHQVAIGSPLGHAPYLEVYAPFLRPALHGKMPEIKRIFTK